MSSELIERVKVEYRTLGEAARLLSVNPATVWRWINNGKLEGHRLGREVLIEQSAIEKLCNARTPNGCKP